MNRNEVLNKAISTWGYMMQEDICIEEMSELTKAIIKNRRNQETEFSGRIDSIKEENADVQIMLDQMRIVYGSTASLEESKLERLAKRLGCKYNA
ncbi:MAG: hypothetical protein E6593_17550 [Clostridium sp.]|nr:hypothetical protein [Clostridium sp.]